MESKARKKSVVIWNIGAVNKGTVTWRDCLMVARLFGWRKVARLVLSTEQTALVILMS